MSDFNTCLIEDSRLQITDEMTYGVVAGAAQSSYQSFVAQTASSSNIIWNVIVPSEQIAIDKNILMKSQINFTLTVGKGDIKVEENRNVWSYGLLDALQSFPLNRLVNTCNTTINNSSTSVNLKDILPSMLCLYDKRELNKYKSLCPYLPDSFYANYSPSIQSVGAPGVIAGYKPGVVQFNTPGGIQDGNQLSSKGIMINANNNPLADITHQSYDSDFIPRGAFKFDNLQIVQIGGPNAGNNVGKFINYCPICEDNENIFIISGSFTTTEPLFISPFTVSPKGNNQAALMGINNMNVQFNIDSTASRMLSSANGFYKNGVNITPSSTITLGANFFPTTLVAGDNAVPSNIVLQPFVSPTLMLNMLTLQPSQYGTIKSRNILPYFDIPRYLSNPSQNVALLPYIPKNYQDVASGVNLGQPPDVSVSFDTKTLTSTSLQLNVIPDFFIINVRKPMATQTRFDADSFLIINQISVSFNNIQGLLANCTQEQLYRLSVMNGSNQSWEQFRGSASAQLMLPATLNGAADVSCYASPTGWSYPVPTSGSCLIISSKDLNLPDFLSAGSLGQFQLFFQVSVSNQLPEEVIPEICVVCYNSGIFTTMQGASQFNVGLLTKQKVLDTKKDSPVSSMDSHEYERLVGGRMNDSSLTGLAQLVKKFRNRRHGGVSSGGASTGCGVSGGRLARHLM